MKTEQIEEKKSSFSKIFLMVIFFLVVILVITYLPIILNWENLRFTISKPNIINAIRLQYEKKQKDVDNSFLNSTTFTKTNV